MASRKKGQRKRKSAGAPDIFEVNEKDLSPEPEDMDSAEPEAKVLKTRNSDVSESRRNNEQHNLKDEVQNSGNSEIITENRENGAVSEEKIDSVNIVDSSDSQEDSVHVGADSSQEQITIDSDEDGGASSDTKTKGDKVHTFTCTKASDKEDECSKAGELNETKNTDEIFTIADDSHDDVIMVCDSSMDLSKDAKSLSSPQILNDDTLEDGEVNDSALEEPDNSMVSPNPAIKITFWDESVAEIYKVKVLKFFQSFVELDVKHVDHTTINIFRDGSLDPKEWVVLDNTVCVPESIEEEELAKELPITPKSENAKKKKKKKKHLSPEKELFVVDTNPGAVGPKPISTKYSTKFLINDEKPEEEKQDISKPSASVCFNCDNAHSLKDCPHPKNYGKINANRQKFQNKNKSTRYHLDDDQKYGHLQPGKISPALREALGLRKNQVPTYIYKMRTVGYPPGWLEEAKFVTSDLAMFDLDGKNVKNTSFRRVKGLDPSKVVDYPGFNVPFEKDFKDEFRYHHAPQFGKKFSKKNMISVFNKLMEQEEDDLEMQDMDLDNTNCSIDDSIEDESISQSKQLDSSMGSDSNNASISLQELQIQKDSLLAEIKKSGEIIPWEQASADNSQSGTDDSKTDKEPKLANTENEGIGQSEKQKLEVNLESKSTEIMLEIEKTETNQMDTSTSSLNVSSNVNCVKHSEFGTPILNSTSPYMRLPNADNFMKGVSPVIDFENLPNSTGKYEQMTGVLQKVRDTLKNLHKSKT